MRTKALFFDIDGTLFSEIDRQVPLSAVLALKKARENGHLVFINTGRTYCQTEDIRREVECDGLLCGCGTYIVVGDEVLYNREVPKQERTVIKELLEAFDLEGVLEGVCGCYMQEQPSRFAFFEKLRKLLLESGTLSGSDYKNEETAFSKLCVMADEKSDMEGFREALSDFEIIDRGDGFYECVPLNHSKATAIAFILEKYHIPKEDAWVFGDSTNDLSMFRFADNAVLMGKHDAELKPYATFFTKTVEEDGIAFALESIGII